MLCQKCQRKVATIHVRGSTQIVPHGQYAERTEDTEEHLCDECGAHRVQELLSPPSEAGSRREKVRVLSVSPTQTVLRLVRKASQTVPEDWTLLTPRLGTKLPVGEELEMMFTEAELDCLQGKNGKLLKRVFFLVS